MRINSLPKWQPEIFTVDSVCEKEYTGGFYPLLVSFRGIAERLNDTMLQITQSSSQVASGSEQVSSGAQALSQGATEQASSVQELAASINEISNKVNENAENARQANATAGSVSAEMNTSNEKMQQMIQAMGDISSCSGEIGKIIKTIEDISFQTNILALNASVEAAARVYMARASQWLQMKFEALQTSPLRRQKILL